MCGIAGIVALADAAPPDQQVLDHMCASIEHRGPDDRAVHVWDGVGLGMQRLSIIDVEGGNQPLFNEDRTVRTVYNGEIYNFRELRRDLEAAGHAFATAADTEVIVHGWEEWGASFAERLNGMFAIAVHDRRNGRFALVRDRLGVKPLYYAVTRSHLVFGSEIKALLASGLIDCELNVDAVGQFLAWEYVPAPATLLQGIHKLEPGAMLEVDLSAASVADPRVWWDVAGTVGATSSSIANGTLPSTEQEWADAVDAQVRASVQRQLLSDVPLGAFLSGGVDSSLMVAGMGDAQTFSIGFDDPSYSELTWARKVAEHLGANHRDEVIRPDVVALFDRLMNHMDDPIGDFSIFPTFLVSQHARQHVKVALSGDGGDELFGGYETYVAQRLAGLWKWIPTPVRRGVVHPLVLALRPRPEKKGPVNMARRFVQGFEHDAALRHARWRLFAAADQLDRLFTPDARDSLTTPVSEHIVRLAARAGERTPLDTALYVDLKSYLSDNILVKVDRMSMACSLEARVPYLDHELVELAFRMPERFKVQGRETKVLLKKVAARHVPRDCVYRAKQGFSIPIKNWLGNEFRPLVADHLSPECIASDGLFAVDEVERLKKEHFDGRENHSHVLWTLLVFQDWRRRWGV